MDTILFKGPNQPDTLEEVVGQAVGAGSICWEDLSQTGIFQDQMARAIVNDVVTWVNEHYIKKEET